MHATTAIANIRPTVGSLNNLLMMDYFWQTVKNCVPPDQILASLRDAGFSNASRTVTGGILVSRNVSRTMANLIDVVERVRPTYFSGVPTIYARLVSLPQSVRPE